MRVLLDECVPRALRKELLDHEVKTVGEAGWTGVKNGELLQLAAGHFDVLLTVDRSLEYQQNFAGVALSVIVMHASTNRLQPRMWPRCVPAQSLRAFMSSIIR
jgi:hypothetical protein